MNMNSDFTCKPIECLDELLNWHESHVKRKYKVESLNRNDVDIDCTFDDGIKVMLCHDMKNNYVEDKYLQGYNYSNGYRFFHWDLIDSFIYFSHHFVTIPTESWINACHANGVRIYGTFITEFDDGFVLCNRFLQDGNLLNSVVDKLVEITLFYGFDGWLLNIENEIRPEHIDNLLKFVKMLTERLHDINPSLYRVIWYDSVIKTGELHWQNELNSLNKGFFDVSDAFFVNYTWNLDNLKNCVINAQSRCNEVYVGIDVFGRNCFGGGGFNCNLAFKEICKNDNLNIALFAPGWLHEAQDESLFLQNSDLFWSMLEGYIKKRRISQLPLVTSFSHGCGDRFYLNGQLISVTPWFNMNLQSCLPTISSNNEVTWCFDEAYYGGNCIEINGDVTFNLFNLDVDLTANSHLQIDYAFKSNQMPDSKFEILIEYIIDDTTKTLCLNEMPIDETNFNIVNFKEYSEVSTWRIRSYVVKFNTNLKITKLLIHNGNSTKTQLGLIRLLSLISNEILSLKRINYPIERVWIENMNVLQLLKKHYLLIDINWSLIDDSNVSYWNIFIQYDEDKTANIIKYVGSTKIQNYKLCLELKDYEFSHGSHHMTHENCTRNNFKIMVHSVNQILETVYDQKSIVKVEIPGRSRIQQIVYDFDIL